LVIVVNGLCQKSPIHQALMPPVNHQHPEEKVAHNSPLLRRVLDPFSKQPVVDNFQEDHAASRRLDPVSTHRFGGRGINHRPRNILAYQSPNDLLDHLKAS
jgi:hypothetical protein